MKHLALVLLFVWLTACSSNPSPIVIEWTTATEINTAGFNLYRAESADGPFTQVNSQLIPASSDPMAGGKYKFEDTSIATGKTYYYQLEDVEYNGTRTKHTPIAVTSGSSFGTTEVLLALLGIAIVGSVLWTVRKR